MLAIRACVEPSPGEQFVKVGVVGLAAAELLQEVADVLSGGVLRCKLAVADHGVQNGQAACTLVAAAKQPVHSSDGNGPQRAPVLDSTCALRRCTFPAGERSAR